MKALGLVMLLILAINVSYAGYGEDLKGECVKGTDSTRGQEVIVEDQVQTPAPKEEGSKTVNK